jgi:sugar phosphate isomerase/epimerase
MRFGGPIFGEYRDPDTWVSLVKHKGFRAANAPVGSDADGQTIRAYADAAGTADIVIAEVGAWSNPLGPDEKARKEAVELCTERLALAEAVGARCCVNISGSRGERWDGPDPRNLTDETFDMIVETVRGIIDAVSPTRTYYCLETMPWMYPDSVDSYRALLRAIDRSAFAVHFDPVNLVSSPERHFRNAELIAEFVEALGPHIRSVHAKDSVLHSELTTHLSEGRPGTGGLDYAALLRQLATLEPDTPLMMEHLPNEDEYDRATSYIRSVADEVGVAL